MQEQMKGNSSILKRFEFRDIRQEEADQAVLIEKICFPPNEACSEKHMKERIGVTPELFLVAVDKTTGKLAGFLLELQRTRKNSEMNFLQMHL